MNYFILFLATICYIQNLALSFFINFTFVPQLIEFMLVLFILLLVSKLKFYKTILYIWQLLYLIHFCFISYFATTVTYVDIYLFFTHTTETFESFFSMLGIMIIPFINFLFAIYIIQKGALQKSNIHSIIPFIFIILSLYSLPKYNDASFILINETIKTYKIDTKTQLENSNNKLHAVKQNNVNIVLVIGESMRAKEYLNTKFSFFEKNNYQTIYSGATNTDVSIPLLINGATRPTKIDLRNNLFQLAKNNNFHTHFITSQNHQYLKYITPYLDKNNIHSFQILATQDDIDLINEIKNINFNQNNFVVLQMQGQHSPYNFYPNASNFTGIQTHYMNSIAYSTDILENVLAIIRENSKKPHIFIFTSDHGELIGENKKYGHNRFEQKIYKVPFVYNTTLKQKIGKISNHNDIYRLIKYHLGYSQSFIPNTLPIKVFGTMINEEDGFITIKQ
jgi:hypothetical protein